MSALLLALAAFGDPFERAVEVKLQQGGTLRIVSRGVVSGGTQHGSARVALLVTGAGIVRAV